MEKPAILYFLWIFFFPFCRFSNFSLFIFFFGSVFAFISVWLHITFFYFCFLMTRNCLKLNNVVDWQKMENVNFIKTTEKKNTHTHKDEEVKNMKWYSAKKKVRKNVQTEFFVCVSLWINYKEIEKERKSNTDLMMIFIEILQKKE